MLVNNTNNISLKDKILKHNDKVIISYDDFKNKFYAIESKDRVHALILGETGSGKSETMKLLVYQNIIRKEGFMLIDPHGMLARDINNLLKRELNDYEDRVIYINPEETNIKINPIEIEDYKRYHLVVLSFINALKNLYEYAWGDRLETILRNALLLVIEADPPCTLSKIARVLSNKKYRDMLVKGSGNMDIQEFWYHIYPNYAMEAFTAVYNKLDKLLSINSIRRIFDCEDSNINISKLIEDNKIIIIDLSTAIADDIIKFLGSLFIHMLYVNAKQHVALANKYYLYIDEAQLISTFAVREVLNALRKFNVSITLATQTINAFDKSIQKELTALCRLVILFRADIDTAKAFAYLFNVSEEKIYALPLHYFYFYQQGEVAARGLAKSYVI